MRETRTAQQSIFNSLTDHEIARELKRMSDWLDKRPELLQLVGSDIRHAGTSSRGRGGLTIESILRCALLKHYRQVDYRTLSFYLMDSVSFQQFARLSASETPSKTTLQRLISAISAGTWERLTRNLCEFAQAAGIEDGRVVRVDATATDTAILEPSDSGLLYDSVRVMVRLLKQVRGYPGVSFHNHQRQAKRLRQQIMYARRNARQPAYERLLGVVADTLGYLDETEKALQKQQHMDHWRSQVRHFRALIEQVIDQAVRRVIQGERVPAEDKIVSLFEPHTDIIVKGNRDVQYGHKLSLTGGRSGLVLDVVVEDGNPSDRICLLPLIKRHIKHYGQPPKQLAADGGYASQENLHLAKQLGVAQVAFHKRVGLTVQAMTGDRWLYNKLRNFRAGIESVISYLKRCFGLSRCNWKGLKHFRAYVQGAVFTHNLVVLTQRLESSG